MSTSTEAPTAGAVGKAKAKGRRQLSEGARAERRLGWMLCAPAVIVMIAVTGYPVIYAIFLSLEKYNLEYPQLVKFIGFSNYAAVLGSSYWWEARPLAHRPWAKVASSSLETELVILAAGAPMRATEGNMSVRSESSERPPPNSPLAIWRLSMYQLMKRLK